MNNFYYPLLFLTFNFLNMKYIHIIQSVKRRIVMFPSHPYPTATHFSSPQPLLILSLQRYFMYMYKQIQIYFILFNTNSSKLYTLIMLPAFLNLICVFEVFPYHCIKRASLVGLQLGHIFYLNETSLFL